MTVHELQELIIQKTMKMKMSLKINQETRKIIIWNHQAS